MQSNVAHPVHLQRRRPGRAPPLEGRNLLHYSAQPPYDFLDWENKYSGLKAPVGRDPHGSWAAGRGWWPCMRRAPSNPDLVKPYSHPECPLRPVLPLGRTAASAVETKVFADMMRNLYNDL
jgi:hypothetical protein